MVWFDLPVRNLAKAMKFYEAVTGWKSAVEFPGVAVFTHQDGMAGGCLTEEGDFVEMRGGPLLYFNVSGRHDEAEAVVQQMDGDVETPKHPIGPFGFRTIVRDPDGNRIALHSEASQ
jgi:hypothetical protein